MSLLHETVTVRIRTAASLLATTLLLGGVAAAQGGTPPPNLDDERESGISIFLASGLDNFISAEQRIYRNPNVSGNTNERFTFGFDVDWRLTDFTRDRQLWLYVDTLHGVRSADVDCPAMDAPAVCGKAPFEVPDDPTAEADYILRNASSFEAHAGLRGELLTFRKGTEAEGRFYIKTELGLMAIAELPGDAVDDHKIAAGIVSSKGRFQDSFFEFGWGRTDLYTPDGDGLDKRLDRWKFDGYVSVKISDRPWIKWAKPFVHIRADTDFGWGSDSIQTHIGFNIDLQELW